jgi:hypothetical protein
MAAGHSHVTEIEAFLAERGTQLLRAAALLASSRDAGEDPLQTALERMLRNWNRVSENPEGYPRRTLHNLAAACAVIPRPNRAYNRRATVIWLLLNDHPSQRLLKV